MKTALLIVVCSILMTCSEIDENVTGPGIQISGTVIWNTLEGGFWAIRGSDNRTYEPINLPKEFEKDGLNVTVDALVRNDLGSFRMVGPVIEIRSITRR